MLAADEITSRLPPLRDDEPSSLRQDIVDEILDHLQCSLRRELLVSGGDEATAMQRVLDQFGDPRQIARKLWNQAMWSKIMTQRFVVGSAILSILASAALVGLVGFMMHRQQEANATLIGQIEKIVSQRTETRDLNRNSLKVKVTKASLEGPAAEGFEILVYKLPGIGEIGAGLGSYSAIINSDGIEDCGYVGAGRYAIQVTTPWGEQADVTFAISPGQDHLEHIVVPDGMPESSAVSISIKGWPEKVIGDAKREVLILRFRPFGSRYALNRTWVTSQWKTATSTPFILCIPNRGIWITAEPEDLSQGYSDFYFADSDIANKSLRWELINQTREWRVPSHGYEVQCQYLMNAEDVAPNDAHWQSSCFFKQCVSQGWMLTRIKVATSQGVVSDWPIAIPDDVARRFAPPANEDPAAGEKSSF